MRYQYILAAVVSVLLLAASGSGLAAGNNKYAWYRMASGFDDYMRLLQAGKITPIGSIRAGNAAGTIPAYQCDPDTTPPLIDVTHTELESLRLC